MYIIRHRWIVIVALCVVLTALCCYAAYKSRGYFAVGGEWLTWMVVVVMAATDHDEE